MKHQNKLDNSNKVTLERHIRDSFPLFLQHTSLVCFTVRCTWIWWWFHGCTQMSEFIELYIYLCILFCVYVFQVFFFLKLLVCLSQRGLNRSQEVYFYAYISSQVLFAQWTKQLEIRWQQLPGIEKGWEHGPNPCTTLCDCHALPGHFQPGCTR